MKMRVGRWARGLAVCAMALAFEAGSALAVSTTEWKLETAEGFRAGKLEGVAVSSLGEATAGFRLKGQKTTEQLVWCLARATKELVYFGTASNGLIYKWEAGRLAVAHKTGQTAVTALVADGAGGVFAGTIPNGKIYKVAADGTLTEFAKLAVKYIWALAFDAASRTLYVGTGPKGTVYKVDESGRASILADTKTEHVLALELDASGQIYAGTARNGLLLKISKAGKMVVVADIGGDEVRAIALHGGAIFAATNGSQRRGMVPPGLPVFGGSFIAAPIVVQPAGVVGRPVGVPVPAAFPRDPGQGTLYRIEAEGRVETLLQLPRGFFTAIEVDPDGNVYVAVGEDGRVYRVTPDKIVHTVFDLKEKQVLALSVTGAEPKLLATGNAGAVYQVSGGRARNPRFTSPVYDAKFVSRWGVVDYRASGKITIRTRSGNTPKPDTTWSDWSDGASDAAKVTSPPARYLQLRAEWSDHDAVLRQIRVFVLNQNQRARLTEVTVDGVGAVSPPIVQPVGMPTGYPSPMVHRAPMMPFQHAMPGAALPRRNPTKRLAWKAENHDGDPLVYSVYVREEASQNWIHLTRKGPIHETYFSWDTESFPDGWYRVKVVASDERANPPHLVLTHEWVTHSVLVDNREPDIVDLVVEGDLTVRGMARDNFSTIKRLEYSLDGGDWVLVFPEGDLHDGTAVRFRFRLPKPAMGAHTLHVRAIDAGNNIGVASRIFTIK